MLNPFRRIHSSTVALVEPAEEPTAVPTRVRPQPTVGEAELAEYVALAGRAKFAPPELLRHRLTQFLVDNQIEVYPLESVERYLDKKFGPPRKAEGYYHPQPTWGWHPLRAEDDGKLVDGRTFFQNGHIEKGGTYRKIVPAPVLETVALIATHFADSMPALHFYVADAATPHNERDPFLAISAVGLDFIVIERWDEPGFRR